uniref:Small ribosomal subunit protein uS8c n=1 Tax=Arachnitis uniflora TaxID=191246 RepID=A0A7D3U9G2_9LILI|nr:30S ribosomal protein S8 [Arachnitis uniflora]QKE31273.1 30S ribosomal protein S8 [Arachnitis uniflora]
MTKYTVANLIISIQNADMSKKGMVRIISTKINESITKILIREGFIESIRKHKENNKDFLVLSLRHRRVIKSIYRITFKSISRPSLRIYYKYYKIPKILGGIGIIILSTSLGIITDREARIKRVGGLILCYIW